MNRSQSGLERPLGVDLMRTAISLQSPTPGTPILRCVMRLAMLVVALLLSVVGVSNQNFALAQATTAPAAHTGQKAAHPRHSHSAATRKAIRHHRSRSLAVQKEAKPAQTPTPLVAVAATPAPAQPPAPNWPVNDHPKQASVIWDSHGLKIEAQNSSLQQILNEVAVETGTKIEGMGADQRVYGAYGPGQAREVLSQLLQGSGYNVLLAGDLGQGTPREVMLSPRRTGAGSPGTANQPNQVNSDDDTPDNEVEEQPEPPQPIPIQPSPGAGRPGFGPNGPVRTPQQVMEEMQQRQLQQQQQQEQQQQPPQQLDTPPTPQN